MSTPSAPLKVAYLILAHNTPNHVRRLVRALDSPNAVFVIHVDRKSDIEPFLGGLSSKANVIFLKNRVAVYWQEYSIIAATLRLIEEAVKHGPDYVCLLSGSDYPLRSASYIEDFFSRRRGEEFINLVPIPCDEVDKPIGRVADYWVETPFGGRVVFKITYRLNLLLQRLGVKRDHTRVFNGLVPYAGSQWWALTGDACRHILAFVEQRPEVMKFMRHVWTPDESFFQLVIGNSPFAARVTRSLWYTDWSRMPVQAPAIIDMTHLDRFVKADVIMADDRYGKGELLFARKFTDDSAALTDFIDRHLHQRREALSEP
jgi:hypothetical protein